MLLKIYGMLWALMAVVALLFLVTGNFTIMTLIGFGFVSFGMIFMGMIAILPSTVVHHDATPKPVKAKFKPATAEQTTGIFDSKHLATR